MLILESAIVKPDGLAFSPDGQSLLAAGNNAIQVWPRWLDKPARKPVTIPRSLERYSFAPDARSVYVYMSGNSRTDIWRITRIKTQRTIIPERGPAWFHFDTAGGFIISSHEDGKLTRFDYDPNAPDGLRESWTLERRDAKKSRRTMYVGSHYRFGGICAPAGAFLAIEYQISARESVDGLSVRSVADGSLIYRKTITKDAAEDLLHHAGLRLAIHPSGGYFAFPQNADVRLYPIAKRVKVAELLKDADLPLPKLKPQPRQVGAPKAKKEIVRRPSPACNAVAFNPSGTLLAAVGNDGTAKLYDTTTWQVVRTFAWDIGRLMAVCFAPDGTRAAAISAPSGKGKKAVSGKVVIWDMDL